jgi:tol-pal system protein YbgF
MNAKSLTAVVVASASLAAMVACLPTVSNDELTNRVNYLRQDVDNLTKQQEALSAQVKDLQAKLGGQVQPSAAPAAQPEASAAPAEEGTQNLSAETSALYKKGFDLMTASQYGDARAAFAEFIAKYPQSDLADNAQYWIGECFYSQKSFKEAAAAFKAVAEHFPFGNKVPDALYKEALCERQLGEEDAAKATLGRLQEQFPDSEAATKARSKT